MSNSSIWPIHGTLSGATTPGQSGPGRDGNKEVPRLPQSSSITGVSPSDCLMSHCRGRILLLCRDAVSVFYSPSRLGLKNSGRNWKSWGTFTLQLRKTFCRRGLVQTDCISYWGVRHSQKGCPMYDIELHLVVRYGECGIPFNCHYSQVHSDPGWLYFLRSHLGVK